MGDTSKSGTKMNDSPKWVNRPTLLSLLYERASCSPNVKLLSLISFPALFLTFILVNFKMDLDTSTGCAAVESDDIDLPEMSLMLSDEDESPKPSVPANKRKRLLVADESEDESAPDPLPPDSDQEGDLHHDKSTRRRAIDDDSDEGEDDDEHNQSKKVIKNLKSLCDEESSDEEKEEPRRNLVGSSDEGESNEGSDDETSRPSVDSANEREDGGLPSPRHKKVKNLKRKAKTEAENVISMIQRNAREDELTIPYHCPEQKSLKDFLESLKSTKSKLVVEEKVELKTHKFKLLKDVPKGVDSEVIEATETDQEPHTEPEPVPGTSSEISLGSGGGKCRCYPYNATSNYFL